MLNEVMVRINILSKSFLLHPPTSISIKIDDDDDDDD